MYELPPSHGRTFASILLSAFAGAAYSLLSNTGGDTGAREMPRSKPNYSLAPPEHIRCLLAKQFHSILLRFALTARRDFLGPHEQQQQRSGRKHHECQARNFSEAPPPRKSRRNIISNFSNFPAQRSLARTVLGVFAEMAKLPINERYSAAHAQKTKQMTAGWGNKIILLSCPHISGPGLFVFPSFFFSFNTSEFSHYVSAKSDKTTRPSRFLSIFLQDCVCLLWLFFSPLYLAAFPFIASGDSEQRTVCPSGSPGQRNRKKKRGGGHNGE